ncbi:MAG: DUF2786 domain-containing protein [Bacteriovoracaceae bacterium]|nr:DUF2786 domain-containing protein [Bacteriovoracaceae bacterium]
MQIYSSSILTFLERVKQKARKVIVEEMRLDYKRKRVLYNGFLHPLNFVVFEDPTKLGWFDSHSWQIGINKQLMYQAKEDVLGNVLRHELAHFFQFMSTGLIDGHSTDFRNICLSFGWKENVYLAKSNIQTENLSSEGDLKSEALIEKVQKLLALSKSSNQHESELATIKANQLITKHNLQRIHSTIEEDVCLKRVLSSKRNNSKLQAIYDILSTFMVQPVFNHGKSQVYIEIIGSRLNVKIAEYVANFLDDELERLWLMTKRDNPTLKGITAKNSFYKGLAKGFLEKQKLMNNEFASGKELITLKNQLKSQVDMVYGRLGRGRVSNTKTDKNSESLGKKIGSMLNIRKGISSKNSSSKTFILEHK